MFASSDGCLAAMTENVSWSMVFVWMRFKIVFVNWLHKTLVIINFKWLMPLNEIPAVYPENNKVIVNKYLSRYAVIQR
jgi:hypothetical protein